MKKIKLIFPKVDNLFLFITILFTITSQYPYLIQNGTSRYLLLIWIIPAIRLVLLRKITFDRSLKVPLSIYVIWVIFLLFMEFFFGEKYSNLPNLVNLSLMLVMMLVGFYYAKKIPEIEFIKIVFWSCFIGGILLCIGIYSFSDIVNYDIMSKQYIFSSKNSAAQILFSCLIYCLLFNSKSKIFLSAQLLFAFVLTYFILLVKCRATILGFLVCVIFLLFNSKNKRIKTFTILFVTSISLLLIFSNNFYKVLIDGILLGGRDINNLDEISSGRLSMVQDFPNLIDKNLFLGRGYFYIESFPLATLVQVGILGSLILFSFIIWVIKSILFRFKLINKIDLCISLIGISLLINSVFEEQAPFGPGAKCFLFWLPFGFVFYKRVHLRT